MSSAGGYGTLFLDEIGDTSGQLQVRLLRVLQEGTLSLSGERRNGVQMYASLQQPIDPKRNGCGGRISGFVLPSQHYSAASSPLRERMDGLAVPVRAFFEQIGSANWQR